MKYVLLIYQGTTPLPSSPEAWATVSEDEQRAVWTDYGAINKTPGVEPGLPLGLPEKATTVRVKDGKAEAAEGPFVDSMGAVGGYLIFEADSIDAAVGWQLGFLLRASEAQSRSGPPSRTGSGVPRRRQAPRLMTPACRGGEADEDDDLQTAGRAV